jgi:hypothetical protein
LPDGAPAFDESLVTVIPGMPFALQLVHRSISFCHQFRYITRYDCKLPRQH